ncbi:MAG: hypothetical protein J7M29_03275 [Verrucomicrobia bacterium]|nr:hypothetical protein [Verrucomicrobiota bacterium]
MRQVWTIAANSFMELIRQPVFLLLMTASATLNVFLAAIPYFGFGDDPNMVKTMTLALTLLAGLFGTVISASASVGEEVRSGTALAVLAKPVSRMKFLLGKYFGLVGALSVLTYVNMLAVLLASRMAYDAYDSTDFQSLTAYAIAVAAAYLAGAFTNYFLNRVFVADAVFAMVLTVTAAFCYIAFLATLHRSFGKVAQVDWRLVPAGVLIVLALCVLAAIALACSTRLELAPTLALCTVVFVLGLMSDYLFGRRAEAGEWWANVAYGALPNWQLFWMGDTLSMGKKIPWSYVAHTAGYALGYLGAALCAGLFLFEDRELS